MVGLSGARQRIGAWVVTLGAILTIIAGCGSATPAASTGATAAPPTQAAPAATVAPTATPTPASTSPATFQLTVSGDANVTGTWGTSFGITCNNPGFDGPGILVFAQSPDAQAVVLITLAQGSIGVSERAGAGANYTDREFAGTGVTSFDPARGAAFDSDVSIAGTGGNPGKLGTITHVSGSIDCGNQTPGQSTVAASGSSAEGAISGPFTSFRVACVESAQYGRSVGTSAIINAGTTPTHLILNLTTNYKATIFSTTKGTAVGHSYAISTDGGYTLSGTGAHVDADFVEVLPAGATGTPHTIHLAGDLTCGTFNKS